MSHIPIHSLLSIAFEANAVKEFLAMSVTRSRNANRSITSELDVRRKIIKDLKEWGIDPTYNKKHKRFWHKAIKQTVQDSKEDASSSVSIDELFDSVSVLSRDVTEAVRQVLQNELEGSEDHKFLDANDVLEFDFKPFYHWFDTKTQSSILRKVPQLKKHRRNELDPFERFDETEHSAEDWFRKIWKTTSLEGYVFEGLVAHHMVHHMQCKSCKCRHQMFWNGGINICGSWADVVCKKCNASYEIKSVASDETFEKKRRFNSFRGGSFRQYHRNPAHYQSRYLVIVSRKETYVRKLEMVHRVSLAKIQTVEPSLCGESFIDLGSPYIRLISNVKLELKSLEKAWCYIKPFKGRMDAIAEEVFNGIYGDGAWSKTITTKETSNHTDKETSATTTVKSPGPNCVTTNEGDAAVKQLRENLRDILRVTEDSDDGDWESMY